MAQLLFVDRKDETGARVLHFLQFSLSASDFRIKTYVRNGDDIEEREVSGPEFLAAASENDQRAFYDSTGIMLSLELLPSLRIVEEA